MKIAMLSTMYLRYPNDTRGLMVSEFNRLLQAEGHEVQVVAPGDKESKSEEVMDGVMVHRFSYFWPRSLQRLAYGPGIPTNLRQSWLARIQVPLFALSFVFKALKYTKNADLIHCQWMPTAIIGLIVNKLRKKPLVMTVRRVETGFLRPFSKYVLKNADLVLFNSVYTQNECLKIAVPKRYRVLHNSVDTTKFSPLPKEKINELRTRSLIPEHANILLFVGLLVEKKGLSYLLQAMHEIIDKYPNTYLVIAGHGTEEPHLKQVCLELQISEKVIFTGRIESNLTPLYFNLADVYVQPSIIDSGGDTETLGVVILEALSCQTPVVASEVGGITDIVTPENGVLVKQKDPLSLAKAIISLLDDKNKREDMGRMGRKRIVQVFGEEEIKKQLRECYAQILSGETNG